MSQLSLDFTQRLVPLCDGRPGLRGGLQVEVRAAPPAADSPPGAVLDFIASSEALDRSDEIIVAAGWRLDNYRRNPVFQNAHQYGDILFTLGKAQVTEVRAVAGRPVLFQRIEFAVDVNPMARIAYGLYQGRFLNAVSVGFIPLRWENGGADTPYRRRYLEQELLEVSAVGIPANPEALQLGLKAGAIQKSDLRDLAEILGGMIRNGLGTPGTASLPNADGRDAVLRVPIAPQEDPGTPGTGSLTEAGETPALLCFRSDTAAPNTHASAPGVPGNGAQWLQLARALRELLRRL